ncbi:MAG TPA: hypothetical protein VFA65_07090 [Bryobacteraceae bacterium]|nr:hypothetical protein [Bryobacteraceae bacterium]
MSLLIVALKLPHEAIVSQASQRVHSNYIAWVERTRRRMEIVKAGMSRNELLLVFK